MPEFGKVSSERLRDAHPGLWRLFRDVVKRFDCQILETLRTTERQQSLYAQGRTTPGAIVTQKDGVNRRSSHQARPGESFSRAVDVLPYPVNWHDTDRMHYFAGYVKRVAEELGIRVRWGGDWDGDTEVGDENFKDLPHWEILD